MSTDAIACDSAQRNDTAAHYKRQEQAEADSRAVARAEALKKIELQDKFLAVMNGRAFELPHVTFGGGPGRIVKRTDVMQAVMEQLVDHDEQIMVVLRESKCDLLKDLKDAMAKAFAASRYVEHVMVERGEL